MYQNYFVSNIIPHCLPHHFALMRSVYFESLLICNEYWASLVLTNQDSYNFSLIFPFPTLICTIWMLRSHFNGITKDSILIRMNKEIHRFSATEIQLYESSGTFIIILIFLFIKCWNALNFAESKYVYSYKINDSTTICVKNTI